MMKKLLKGDGIYSFAASLIAILLGVLVGAVVLFVANPAQALNGLKSLFIGGFVDMKNVGQTLYYATPIIMTGLSVGFANKCGLFNIGGSGQFIVGAYAAVLVGVKCTFLPTGLHCAAALLAAVLAGALWGLLPGVLKALCNVNEVISCIMMNYIGMSMVNLLVRKTVFDQLKNQSKMPAASAILPKMGFDKIFVAGKATSSANAGIIIAIVAGIIMWVVLSKTKFGYELKACGYNRDAAKYAGINEKRSIIMSMVIAGALAGLGGALMYLAGAGKGIHVVDTLAAEGFTGIPVALLGMSNPIGIIFAGLFMAHLTMGGFNMQIYGFVPQVIDIITSVIIYFSAFALFFQLVLRKKFNKGADDNANAEKALSAEAQALPEVLPENQGKGGEI
ncbi:MAG: ABC transporter permease [Oscillospiraceae bacterium]|nr:ABC transporter permease [Oscillospiraceae bacterium]